MVSDIMVSVIMASVIRLSVVAPSSIPPTHFWSGIREKKVRYFFVIFLTFLALRNIYLNVKLHSLDRGANAIQLLTAVIYKFS
jgi:hypothetical protein